MKVINRIVNGRTSVSAEMALKLAAAFSTTPEFWLNAQKAVDLFRAQKTVEHLPALARAIPFLAETSIGHALTADALVYGMAETVKRFLKALEG